MMPDDDHPRPHPPTRILRTPQVARKLGISRAALWRWYKAGHFPAPIILGHGTFRPVHGWRESDVDEWLASRPTVGMEGVS